MQSLLFTFTRVLQFAEKALSHELLVAKDNLSAEYYIALARLSMMRKQYGKAKDNLELASSLNNEVRPSCGMFLAFAEGPVSCC